MNNDPYDKIMGNDVKKYWLTLSKENGEKHPVQVKPRRQSYTQFALSKNDFYLKSEPWGPGAVIESLPCDVNFPHISLI